MSCMPSNRLAKHSDATHKPRRTLLSCITSDRSIRVARSDTVLATNARSTAPPARFGARLPSFSNCSRPGATVTNSSRSAPWPTPDCVAAVDASTTTSLPGTHSPASTPCFSERRSVPSSAARSRIGSGRSSAWHANSALQRRASAPFDVTTSSGTHGRYFAARRAIFPLSENTTAMPGFTSTAAFASADTDASTVPTGFGVNSRTKLYAWLWFEPISACCWMEAMRETARAGWAPLAVSPESMHASAPSQTALAMSEISARVGCGESIMLSIICVAQMTKRPAICMRRQRCMSLCLIWCVWVATDLGQHQPCTEYFR